MDVKAACEYLGISRQSLMRLAKIEKLKGEKKQGVWDFPIEEVNRYKEERESRVRHYGPRRDSVDYSEQLNRIEDKLDVILQALKSKKRVILQEDCKPESVILQEDCKLEPVILQEDCKPESAILPEGTGNITDKFTILWKKDRKRWHAYKKIQDFQFNISIGTDKSLAEQKIKEYFGKHPDKLQLFLAKYPEFKEEFHEL